MSQTGQEATSHAGRQLGRPRVRDAVSSSAERVVKNDDALCTIHFRAW
jgi:hypothetical protein